MQTVVALYDEREDARDAVEDLDDAGFDRSNISFMTRGREGEIERVEEEEDVTEGAVAGGTAGAIIGGIGGLLVGLGTLLLPGLGLIVAAGPIVGLLSGAVAGGLIGGVIGALVDLGIPEEEAELYAEAIRRGGTFVAVQTSDARADEAAEILEDHDPIDLDYRTQQWRERGWEGVTEETEPYSWEKIERERELYSTHEEEDIDTLIDREDVADIGTRSEWREEEWRQYEPEFRTHYERTYPETDRDYDYYVVAYRYGYNLASNPRYRDYDWSTLEPEARERWERQYGQGTWPTVRDAVYTSYNRYVV